jgi:hypothetical protein
VTRDRPSLDQLQQMRQLRQLRNRQQMRLRMQNHHEKRLLMRLLLLRLTQMQQLLHMKLHRVRRL